jgi:hypothetical protein
MSKVLGLKMKALVLREIFRLDNVCQGTLVLITRQGLLGGQSLDLSVRYHVHTLRR